VVIIGIDPHKATHTAVVVDEHENVLAELQVKATSRQRDQLLEFAARFAERTWAVESAGGLGDLLARELVDAGEHVVDVPATLAARVRLLGSGKASKNDPNDARSTAIAALRHPRLREPRGDHHSVALRLLVDRHHGLVALRTQTVNRLHALLCSLTPGGHGRRMSADQAQRLLRSIRPTNPVDTTRKAVAVELLADVRRFDRDLVASKKRITEAVTASKTSLVEIYGVGPIVAAIVIGHVADVRRFPTRDHFASYNGTAPIEASSGPKKRHRLNPRGNRTLNYALHMVAVTQIANDTPGRAFFDRKLEEGKTKKEALRALKRRISDAVYRQLVADIQRES
jgi:transposase